MPKGNRMNRWLKGRVILFATNNIHKFNEARRVMAEFNIAVGMLRVKSLEIQSNSLEEIAKASVQDAFEKCHLPIIVEDAGLFVDALNGFPGPYTAYVYKTVGNEGLLKLMENVENRKAHFASSIAYLSAEVEAPLLFNDLVRGKIAEEARIGDGKSGFGFDPVFVPGRNNKTFAEMVIEEKNGFSHRAKALRGFGKWYKS